MESNLNVGSSQADDERRAREAADREAADRKTLDDRKAADRKDADAKAWDRKTDDNNRAADRRLDLASDALDRKADDRRSEAQPVAGDSRNSGRDDDEARRRADHRRDREQGEGTVGGEDRFAPANEEPSVAGELAMGSEPRPIMRPDEDKPLWQPGSKGSEAVATQSDSTLGAHENTEEAAERVASKKPAFIERMEARNAAFAAANEAAGRTVPSAATIARADGYGVAIERAQERLQEKEQTREADQVSGRTL